MSRGPCALGWLLGAFGVLLSGCSGESDGTGSNGAAAGGQPGDATGGTSGSTTGGTAGSTTGGTSGSTTGGTAGSTTGGTAGSSTGGTAGSSTGGSAGTTGGTGGDSGSGGGSGLLDVECDDAAGSAELVLLSAYNISDCETVTYPLAFIYGDSPDASAESVTVRVGYESRSWPAMNGVFKALVMLEPGENHLRFEAGTTTQDLRISFEAPASQPKKVQLFYYMGSDKGMSMDEPMMDAPPGNDTSLAAAIERIKMDGLLIQTFMAEALKRSREHQTAQEDLPRETFYLELEGDGSPSVHLLRHDSMTQQELWDRDDGGEDWGTAWGLSQQLPDADSYTYIGYSSVSHTDPNTGVYQAGLCLGTGNLETGGLGMCEGGNLFLHAPSLDLVVAHFSDYAMTDNQYIVEDSQGRGMNWAGYGTVLGGLLHEGSHGFTLPHTDTGIMSADSGKMNRFFMIFEPSADGSRNFVTVDSEVQNGADLDWWHPDSVTLLTESPFIY